MLSLAELSLASVRASAMALTNETLSHLVVLVGLVTPFCESYSCEFIKLIKLHHELLYGPNLTRFVKLFHECYDLLVVGQVDQRVVEEGGRVTSCYRLVYSALGACYSCDDVRLKSIIFRHRLKIVATLRLWLLIIAINFSNNERLELCLEAAVSRGLS